MTDENEDSSGTGDDPPFEEQLLHIFESFADEFSERSIPVHLTQVLREGNELKADKLQQHPESFIEKNLIWPTLSALGYEFIHQPDGYPKWDNTRPDFEIQNFDCTIDCVVIGKVKTPNHIDEAQKDIQQYLNTDLSEHTVGIATDGIQWKISARPKKSAEVTPIESADLTPVFRKLPHRHEEQETYDDNRLTKQIRQMQRLTQSEVSQTITDTFQGDMDSSSTTANPQSSGDVNFNSKISGAEKKIRLKELIEYQNGTSNARNPSHAPIHVYFMSDKASGRPPFYQIQSGHHFVTGLTPALAEAMKDIIESSGLTVVHEEKLEDGITITAHNPEVSDQHYSEYHIKITERILEQVFDIQFQEVRNAELVISSNHSLSWTEV